MSKSQWVAAWGVVAALAVALPAQQAAPQGRVDNVTNGVVTAVSATALTVQPRAAQDNATAPPARTFALVEETLYAQLKRGAAADITPGTWAAVLTDDAAQPTARTVAITSADGGQPVATRILRAVNSTLRRRPMGNGAQNAEQQPARIITGEVISLAEGKLTIRTRRVDQVITVTDALRVLNIERAEQAVLAVDDNVAVSTPRARRGEAANDKQADVVVKFVWAGRNRPAGNAN